VQVKGVDVDVAGIGQSLNRVDYPTGSQVSLLGTCAVKGPVCTPLTTPRSTGRREAQYRANGDSRPVPAHPELVALLRKHLEEFGTAPDGAYSRHPRRRIADHHLPATADRNTASRVHPAEYASPLARRPDDLWHACLLSTWLNGGVPPT
jgi:hypothetical protein